MDSHIQRIILATEETTMTQVSHRSIKCQSRSWSQEVQKSTGRIMVTTRYSDQQGSKSRRNIFQVQPTEKLIGVKTMSLCLWVQTTVSTVWSAASFSEFELLLQVTEKTVRCHPLISVKTVSQTSLLHIESNPIDSDFCHLPTASFLSNKADNSRSNQF